MKRLYAIVLVLGLVWTSSGFAADAAGVVKTRRGEAHVERAGERFPLDPGADVFQGDRVLTGATGYVGITMHDDTLLTLGPNALLVVDRYAFDSRTSRRKFPRHAHARRSVRGNGTDREALARIVRREDASFDDGRARDGVHCRGE